MNKAVATIAIAVILIIGGLALANKNENKNTPATNTSPKSDQSTQPSNNSSNSQTGSDQNQANTITYSNNGFSPNSLTVKSGSDITIKNISSTSVDFESDPHPQHTDNLELDVGTISSGQSKTFTVTIKGTWGYHNNLNPSDTGAVVIQ